MNKKRKNSRKRCDIIADGATFVFLKKRKKMDSGKRLIGGDIVARERGWRHDSSNKTTDIQE